MQNKNKGNMVFWVLIVVAVVGFLVYLTISKKDDASDVTANALSGALNNEQNMNTQQIEGVKITILKEGTGDVAKAGDTVAMNYTGQFLDGRAFDSNVDPKFGHVEPFVFVLGAGQVIKGWDVGVAGMKVGEKRNLVIEPAYAYGENGAGGVIPPNATLSFEVELLAIKK
ncbi:MAG: FKBP-type peptidyl-prolyl cis-trans isomerase [Candidatus Paceibacterota bacterium]|jgi:FKBP-type peptidyl-prolyl cis-trans isomerase